MNARELNERRMMMEKGVERKERDDEWRVVVRLKGEAWDTRWMKSSKELSAGNLRSEVINDDSAGEQ